MADSQAGAGEKLYTLTEISQKTGISMPTLQRYKKMYQGRIPSVGKGRSQRYPESSLAVFHELKQENIGRRGRPRKNAAARAPRATRTPARRGRPPKAVAAAAETKSGLLTLTQIGEMTGISYPTLLRYVKSHGDRIPTVGRGRGRRYKPEAVDIFRDIRSKSRRGRKAGSAKAEKPAARRVGRPRKAAKVAKVAKVAKAAKPAKRGRPRKVAAAAADSGVGSRVKALEGRLAKLEKLLGKVGRSWR